ncbi:ABC transporter substrate-binding protein [Auraticoccus monumenti]|uniref:Peptide/nickel transport system substrate-binding protein n=1 Tax=Auraticoccus monumenti TaxID=675864 RepID=A0A1G7BFA7_9ACTN|nr:ABC transporter substrate-binding protein [Auraticoccus monumenti]SDE25703.1 peptide/nickel transport system substrate-binding protein [Auraticoccus monumenti]
MSGLRRLLGTVCLLVAAVLLAGCTEAPLPDPVDPSSPSPSPRPYLTIGTTDVITQPDPAGITTQASSAMAFNVFQRLMTVPPTVGDEEVFPKPEAAQECQVESVTVYLCILNPGMTFHNGHALTSSDVKFSIERALRLDVEGTGVSGLEVLRRIETPDDLTIRFELNRPDNRFNFALASPVASIVDEEVYDPDRLRGADLSVAGSGPYRVSQLGEEQVRFDRFAKYIGPTAGLQQTLLLQSFPDSGSLEQAMTEQRVDAVWRGLGSAAVTRMVAQIAASPQQRTEAGFAEQRVPGARVHRLHWSPDSPLRPDAALRDAVNVALQGDRTLDSIVPPTVAGYVPSFDVGGQATPQERPGRSNLVLSYDSTVPDGGDLANVVRSRIEAAGDMSVRVAPDAAEADLFLVDEKAWTPTAEAWLQAYVNSPAVGSTVRVQELMDRYRAETDPVIIEGLLSELQKQAGADAVLLPLDQSDEPIYLAEGTSWTPGSFGPGWQLGLWGITRA